MDDIREEAKILQTMIDSAPAGFCRTGLDGRFLKVNPKFCELTGYSQKELVQMKFDDLTHPDDREPDQKAVQAMLRDEFSVYHVEKRYRRKTGEILWVDLTSSLYRDANRNPKYFISITQKALSSSERRFRTLFQQAPFSAQLLDLEGRTLMVNTAWERLWGVTMDSIKDRLFNGYNVLTDPQLEKKGVTPSLRAAYRGESVVTKPIFYDPKESGQSGRGRWLLAYAHPIKNENGDVIEVMLIHHDVTDTIESEEKLKSAKDAAEAANRLKSAFLANMSHEIRTPLNAILGFTELLKDRNVLEEEHRKFIQIIDRNGRSLIRIIDDILEISRIEAGGLKIEKKLSAVKETIEEAMNLFKIEAEKKRLFLTLNIQPDTPKLFYTDPVRLKQIVINIVGNAIKFTQEGGISVTLRSQSNKLVIVVKDTGLGIPRENRSWLFRPFSQLDTSATRKFGGTGLGLALSKKFATALGGDIQLTESQPDQGSTFTVTLPAISHGISAAE